MELKDKQNIYLNLYIKKFINSLIKKGKRMKIEKIFFLSLRVLKLRYKLDPLYLCLFVLDEIKLILELKSLRLGSVIYRIPVPLAKEKQLLNSIKLFIKNVYLARVKGSFSKTFLKEFDLVLQKKSSVLKQNQQLYKTASNNRAFAHFRW